MCGLTTSGAIAGRRPAFRRARGLLEGVLCTAVPAALGVGRGNNPTCGYSRRGPGCPMCGLQ